MKKYIAVIGSSRNVSKESLAAAEEIGALIAKRDAILVCGGRSGVMEAACKGAKSQGGLTVGILPGHTREEANKYVDVAIPSGLGFSLRNFITIRSADAVIMIQGEVGTLNEVILSYQHGKPLVVHQATDGWAGRLQQVALEQGAYLDERRLMEINYRSTAEDVVERAFELIGTVSLPEKL